MLVHVNGEAKEVSENITVAELIRALGLGGAACAAEVNKGLVPRRDHERTALKEGDRVELVSLVGGG